MGCKCWFCGEPLVWQSDFLASECFGESGDPEEDDKVVAILECSGCHAFAYFVEGSGEDDEEEEE